MSRDGLLPPAFGKVHPRFRTPYIPTVITGVAVGIAAALLPIGRIAELANIGTLFAFVLVCLGVWILRGLEPGMKRPFRTPLVPLVPILGVVFCVYLMARLPTATWIRFVVWLTVGLFIYLGYGRFNSRVALENEKAARTAAAGR
jgi:APA family basic amino acid/polyamine antiporter